MDDSERSQRMIGLTAQVYYARRDSQDPDDPEVTAGLRMLIEGLGDFSLQGSVELPQTAEELQSVIIECADAAVEQVGRRAYGAVVDMISLFCDFATYAEQTSPDIDVPEFLRQAGIRASSDE